MKEALNALILKEQLGDPTFNNNKISAMRDCVHHVLSIIKKDNAKELIQHEIAGYKKAIASITGIEFDDTRHRLWHYGRLSVYETALKNM